MSVSATVSTGVCMERKGIADDAGGDAAARRLNGPAVGAAVAGQRFQPRVNFDAFGGGEQPLRHLGVHVGADVDGGAFAQRKSFHAIGVVPASRTSRRWQSPRRAAAQRRWWPRRAAFLLLARSPRPAHPRRAARCCNCSRHTATAAIDARLSKALPASKPFFSSSTARRMEIKSPTCTSCSTCRAGSPTSIHNLSRGMIWLRSWPSRDAAGCWRRCPANRGPASRGHATVCGR